MQKLITFRDISSDSSSFKREFDAIALVLIEFTIFVLLFAFILKCDDNKANKNVDHKKCDNYYIYYIKHCNKRTEIMNGTHIFSI
jgi:hypothetical protein